MIRTGRKHEFPFVCSLGDDLKKQIYWASRLLLSVVNTWPPEDIPALEDFVLEPGNVLFNDSQWILDNALGQTEEFKKTISETV